MSNAKIAEALKKLKKQNKRGSLDEYEWARLVGNSVDSGGLKKNQLKLIDTREFAVSEKGTTPKPAEIKVPNWLKGFIQKKKKPEDALVYLIERVERAPNKNALMLAQAFINELLRTREGQKFCNKILNQKVVEKFITISQPKKVN